jgi:hypothetical protein
MRRGVNEPNLGKFGLFGIGLFILGAGSSSAR